MNADLVFVLKIIALISLFWLEDFILWNLYFASFYQNQKGDGHQDNSYKKADQQSIEKTMVGFAQILDSRANEPEDKSEYSKASDNKNRNYYILGGIIHLPSLVEYYLSGLYRRVG